MTLKSNIILGPGGHSRVILENLYILKKKNIKIYDFNFSYRKNNTILKNKVIDFKKYQKKKFQKITICSWPLGIIISEKNTLISLELE